MENRLSGTCRCMRLTVVGVGRLGSAHAATLSAMGHDVLGIDVDESLVSTLAEGRSPYAEPGLERLLAEGTAAGRLAFTTDLSRAAAHARVHFVCVGTPQSADGPDADLSAVRSVVDALVPTIEHPSLLVGKSTVPVGTARLLIERIRARERSPGCVELAWNPEFLREAHAVEDSLRPSRLVLGVESAGAERMLRNVYAPLVAEGVRVITTDLETAELAKVSANVMLAARVSLVNVLAEMCERSGADVADLVDVVGADPRIGRQFLAPGLGFGGGCLPKDLQSFLARGRELGMTVPLELIAQVDAVNRHQRDRVLAIAQDMVGGSLRGKEVAVLGAAFKAGVDDIRDSPALAEVVALRSAGARVRVHDPAALTAAKAAVPGPDYLADVEDACRGAEVLLLLTEWPEYAALDPVWLRGLMASPRLLDARLVVDVAAWQAAGWEVRALGRSL